MVNNTHYFYLNSRKICKLNFTNKLGLTNFDTDSSEMYFYLFVDSLSTDYEDSLVLEV